MYIDGNSNDIHDVRVMGSLTWTIPANVNVYWKRDGVWVSSGESNAASWGRNWQPGL
jgi:hypothetical protein